MTDGTSPQIPDPPGWLVTSRQWLYDAVWSRPLAEVALSLGVSGHAIRKACRSHTIPMPQPSYWAKLAAGETLARRGLPAASPQHGERVRIWVNVPAPPPPPAYAEPLPEVIVEPVPTRPHPLVKATMAKLKAARPDQRGGLRPGDGGLSARVSEQGIKRAVSLLDALVKALEQQGHRVRPARTGFASAVTVRGEDVHFELNERVDRKRHRTTPEEQAERNRQIERLAMMKRIDRWDAALSLPSTPEWDFLPSNEFSLSITSYGVFGLRRMWKDGPTRRLEAMLPEVVVEFDRYGDALKVKRVEDEERVRREEEEEQRCEEEARRQQLEQQRQDALEHDAAQWECATRIRAYVAEVRARADAEGRAKEMDAWCRWADSVADSLDPVPARLSRSDEG